jgi:hypothetical protein
MRNFHFRTQPQEKQWFTAGDAVKAGGETQSEIHGPGAGICRIFPARLPVSTVGQFFSGYLATKLFSGSAVLSMWL